MLRHWFVGALGVVLWSGLWAQQSAPINFIARATACELDANKDGRCDYWYASFYEGVSSDHVQLSLDNVVRFSGTASQKIRLQRNSGNAGFFVIFTSVNFNSPFKPQVGEALLTKVAIRAEGFQNATYQVYITTGSRRIHLLPETSQDTGGWQQLSAAAPVELDQDGAPYFSLVVEFRVQDGAASGTFWIDEAYMLSARTVQRANQLPNGLKLCFSFLYREQDPYAYLNNLLFKVVMGANQMGQVLQRLYPDTVWMPYCYFSGTLVPPIYRYNSDLYNYDDVLQNHPDWFLLDQDGQRIPYGEAYYIDVGRQDVRERAWQSLRDFLNRCGRPRYVYLDNVDMRVGPDRFNPPNYPTNEAWVNAVVGWFEYVGSRVRQEFGTTFVPNAAWSPAFWLRGIPGVSQDAPGVATLPYIGGFLIEHAFTHARSNGQTTISNYGTATGTNGPQRWDNWALRNAIRLATEYPEKIVILMPTFWTNAPDSRQKIRFAIAMCLIVQHENTYIQLDPRYQQEEYRTGYFPPELFIPLGNPTGNFRIQDGDIIVGGLFIREYQNGIVLANPRSDRDFTFVVPRDLYDWDRNLIRAGNQITIPRQTGLVLWSAPEITVSLSPEATEVLPGATVQFTVTYRNTGTAPGTNVRIAVPLPDGMTLVSSDPPAQLENRTIVWTVPSIPVNGTGSLRFTVRVQ